MLIQLSLLATQFDIKNQPSYNLYFFKMPLVRLGTIYLLGFSLMASVSTLAQQQKNDVVNYGREADQSGGAVAAITVDNDGILYFATTRGVVVYDGETWQEIDLSRQGVAHIVEYDSLTDRIYVGGTQYFGFLKRDRNRRLSYVDLSSQIIEKHPFKDVWQIFRFGDEVYFMTPVGRYVYASDSVTFHDFPESYFFRVGSTVYLSERKSKLSIFKDGKLIQTWDQSEHSESPAFKVLALDQQHHLILYPQTAPFIRDVESGSIVMYDKPLSSLIEQHWLYNAVNVSNDMLAIASWNEGLFITDTNGDIIRRFTTDDRLQSEEIYEVKLGPYERLWLATTYGISMIDMRKTFPNVHWQDFSKYPAYITSYSNAFDTLLYTTTRRDTAFVTAPGSRIEINFSSPGADYFLPQNYRYRLLNYDSAWKETTDPVAIYPDLPNGGYVFQVANDQPNLDPAQLVIIVELPFLAFLNGPLLYLFYALIVLALLIVLIVYRAKRARYRLALLIETKTEEIRRHEQELIRTNNELKEVNEELDTFLYRSSHDLIAPVKSIRGLLQLLRISKEDPAVLVEMMEDRILRLEATLLEINGYVKNSKSEPVATNIQLHHLINEAWEDIEFVEHADRITFRNEVERELVITSDPELWKMIVHNLLINAIKYHDKGKSNQYIVVRQTDDKQFFSLYVEDNGQGISPDLLPRVYDMFFRANERSTGSGLGLFLVKKMVDKLGGTISIDSVLGDGTIVSVSVPDLHQSINISGRKLNPEAAF